MTIQDTAIEKLRLLPEPLAHLVNDFIDFLLSQWAKLPSLPSEMPPSSKSIAPSPLAPSPLTFRHVAREAEGAWNQAMVQIASPDPGQPMAVTQLFAAWADEDDAAEQRETLQWLTQALEGDWPCQAPKDRLSNRPLFS